MNAFARLLAPALVSTVLFAAPAAAQVFEPESFVLQNGMQVVVVSNHRVPVVSHMVWYRVGAADEPQGKSGIAHLLEHLMFKSTETLASGEFSRVVARHGGRDNAFTSSDYTAYFQNVAKEHLALVMRMEADRMANLRIDPAEVRTEVDVVLEERRSRIENDPGSLLREQAQAVMFLNHPYRNPVIGWAPEIARLDHNDAQTFYDRWYAPNNAILIVAGDITAAELKPLAEKYYGPIPPRQVPKRVRPPEPDPLSARRVELRHPDVRQPSWSRRFVAPSYTAGETRHAYPLQILAEVIGGSSTSRLYRNLVVDKQLAAGAGAFYDGNSLDLATFGVFASPRPGIAMDELEQAMEAELADIAAGNVDPAEVERAKERLRANVAYARDSLQAGAYAFGQALTTGSSIEDVEQWPQRIAAVTPQQVREAARAVLRSEGSVTALLLPGAGPRAVATAPQPPQGPQQGVRPHGTEGLQ